MGLLLAAAGVVSGPPDGTLVMGVIGSDRSASAVHGERAMVADPRTGATRIRRLAGGTLCHGPLMAVGDRVLYSGYRGRRPLAMSLPLTLEGRPRSLGAADTITPSANPGRVWLGRWRHGKKTSRVALRELSPADGGVSARTSELLPRWTGIGAALDGGFVITHGRWLTFWEHGLDRPLRSVRDASLVAAHPSRFAWCDRDCEKLRVWSRTGERPLDPPAGMRLRWGGGAFSPDGRTLALPVTHAGKARAAVVDLATRRWTLVPRGLLRGYEAMAWSPSGRRLYFTGPGRGVWTWEHGAARAERLPIDAHGTVMSIAVAG